MKPNELPELERRLAELAEVFGTRPPGKGALNVWLDTLRECGFDDVLSVLCDWAKGTSKPPLPAEVLKLCRQRASDRLEQRAKTEREMAPKLSDLVAGLSKNLSPEAKRAKQEIMEWLAVAKGRASDPKAWAKRLKAREEAGEFLNDVQRRSWREALRFGGGA